MSRNKPIAGFPSIKKAVNTLLSQGMFREDIVKTLGITLAQFRSASGFSTHVALPDYVTEALQPYADARRMKVSILIRYILQTMIDDKLIDTVLDDTDDDLKHVSKKLRNSFILEHYRKDLSKSAIAKQFNISLNHVNRICAREKNGRDKTT